jgi:putative spermidine/putrescine transport system permease protein
VAAITASVFGADGREALDTVLSSNSDQKALLRTVRVSAIVTILSVVLGSALAWALVTIRHRGWRILVWVAVLAPFWMSVVVKNYAFVLLLRDGGPVHAFLSNVGLIGPSTKLLFTETAVILGMLYAMLPYAVLPLYATFLRLDLTMISAAESLGASRVQALWNVAAPLCARGVLAAATLVFVISLGFYVTPVILGGPTAPFAATAIGSAVFEFFDIFTAKALAVILLALALISAIASQLISRYVLKGEDR